MDFARINPKAVAEIPATYSVEYEGEQVFNGIENKPLKIDFYGLDSDAGKRATAKLAKKLDRAGTKSIANMTEEQIILRAKRHQGMIAELYGELVHGWENIPDFSGKRKADGSYPPLPFTKENAVRLFSEAEWMAAGIEDFLAERRKTLLDPETT